MLYFRGQYKRIVKGTARFFYNLSSMDVPCHRYVPTNSCFYSKRFVGYMKQNIYTTVYETNNDQKKQDSRQRAILLLGSIGHSTLALTDPNKAHNS